jgi:hypothetical protein
MTLFADPVLRNPCPPAADRWTARDGGAGDGVAELLAAALAHPAVRHPFLVRCAQGGWRDLDGALLAFARDQAGCVAWTVQGLHRALVRLPGGVARDPWLRRFARERGQLDDADCALLRRASLPVAGVQGVPRAVLFERFALAVGVTPAELAAPSPAAAAWVTRWQQLARDASPTEVVGAWALGTEAVARTVWQQLLRGVLLQGTLRRDELVWLELQCLPDDRLQRSLAAGASALAQLAGGLDELRTGMEQALQWLGELLDRVYLRVLEAEAA